VNTALPTASGTTIQGSVLTATTGTWTGTQPITFTYQWQRCNSAGSGCAALAGAIGSSYTLTAADVGSTLVVVVTATNSVTSTAATSAATTIVTPFAPIAFDKAAPSGTSSSKTVSITPSTSGNAIFVLVATANAAATVVVDNVNAGNYIAVPAQKNGATNLQWWYHLNVAAAPTTITMTTTSTGNSMVAYSLSGVASSSVISANAGATGSTTSLTTTTLPVSNNGSALLAGWADWTIPNGIAPFIAAGSGWTTSTNENSAFFPVGVEHQMNVSSGTSAVTATAQQSTAAWVGASIVINPN
jgi:hypothetical protein